VDCVSEKIGQKPTRVASLAAHLRRAAALVAALCISGCCLAPNTVRTEVSHLSHIGQHFGDHKTNYGAQYAEVIARWQFSGAYVDVGQGYNLSPGMGTHTGWDNVCAGGICGPRELTTVSVGYEWRLK
jgi:hypothetical protein